MEYLPPDPSALTEAERLQQIAELDALHRAEGLKAKRALRLLNEFSRRRYMIRHAKHVLEGKIDPFAPHDDVHEP